MAPVAPSSDSSSFADWAAAIIAGMAFALSLYAAVSSHRERVLARRVSVLDEYWFRTVLSPVCIEPLVGFILNCTTKIGELGGKDFQQAAVQRVEYEALLADHKKKKADLVLRLRLLDVVDPALCRLASRKLDALEDLVVRHCAVRSLPPELRPPDASTADIISAAMDVYTSVGRGIGHVLANITLKATPTSESPVARVA